MSVDDGGDVAPILHQQSAPPAVSSMLGSIPHEDATSHASTDVLDQILDNYQFVFVPECRLKFKKQLAGYTMSLCLAKPWHLPQRWRLTAKPDEEGPLGRWVQKVLLVPSYHQFFMFTRKMTAGIFRLQLVGGFNWHRQKPTLDYRITTKWSDGPKIKRKERLSIGKFCLTRCYWNLDLHLPDMEGHLGDRIAEASPPLDVDFGHMDFEISQLDCVFDIDNIINRPAKHKPHSDGGDDRAASHASASSSSRTASRIATGSVPTAASQAKQRAAAAQHDPVAASASAVAVPSGTGSSSSSRSSAGLNPLEMWWQWLQSAFDPSHNH